MGMTIDEIKKHIEDMKKGVYLVYPEELYDSIIQYMRKYQMIQIDYKARLKADMVAMLEDLDLKIDEMYEPQFSKEGMDGFYWAQGLFKGLVQEKINALKEAADE